MRPTATGAGAIVLGVAATAWGLIGQISEALTAGLLLGLALGSTAVLVLTAPRPVACRNPVRSAHAGEPVTLTYTCARPRGPRSWLLVPRLTDTFDGRRVRIGLPAGQVTVTPTRRGTRGLGPVTPAWTDCLGLWQRPGRPGQAETVLVLPAVVCLDQPGRQAGHGGHGVRAGGGDGPVAGVRPYVAGDELRSVHWLSTARAGALMVRQNGAGTRDGIEVRLDSGADRYRDEEEFDRAVALTAGVLTACLTAGVPCTIRTSGGQVWLGRHPADSTDLLVRLARLRPDTSRPSDPGPGTVGRTVLIGPGPVAPDPRVLALATAGQDGDAVLVQAGRQWRRWLDDHSVVGAGAGRWS